MQEADSREAERIARLAHELRNRIAPIRNATQLLRIRDRTGADLQSLIELIERQLQGMVEALDSAVGAVRTAPGDSTSTGNEIVTRGGRRVLLADDSAAMRESLGEILRDQGHSVRVAADGAEALEIAAGWLPEIVILDIHMPQLDGYEVARMLRAKFSALEMKLIMMSGTALDPAAERNALKAGFDLCIDKVIDLPRLETLLQEA